MPAARDPGHHIEGNALRVRDEKEEGANACLLMGMVFELEASLVQDDVTNPNRNRGTERIAGHTPLLESLDIAGLEVVRSVEGARRAGRGEMHQPLPS
jgi:hypothetical protein